MLDNSCTFGSMIFPAIYNIHLVRGFPSQLKVSPAKMPRQTAHCPAHAPWQPLESRDWAPEFVVKGLKRSETEEHLLQPSDSMSPEADDIPDTVCDGKLQPSSGNLCSKNSVSGGPNPYCAYGLGRETCQVNIWSPNGRCRLCCSSEEELQRMHPFRNQILKKHWKDLKGLYWDVNPCCLHVFFLCSAFISVKKLQEVATSMLRSMLRLGASVWFTFIERPNRSDPAESHLVNSWVPSWSFHVFPMLSPETIPSRAPLSAYSTPPETVQQALADRVCMSHHPIPSAFIGIKERMVSPKFAHNSTWLNATEWKEGNLTNNIWPHHTRPIFWYSNHHTASIVAGNHDL